MHMFLVTDPRDQERLIYHTAGERHMSQQKIVRGFGGGPGSSSSCDGESEETKAWACQGEKLRTETALAEAKEARDSPRTSRLRLSPRGTHAEAVGQHHLPPSPRVSLAWLWGHEAKAPCPVALCPMWQSAEARPPVCSSRKTASLEW